MTYEQAFLVALEANRDFGLRYFLYKDTERGTYHVSHRPVISHRLIRVGEVRRFCR